MTGIPLGLGTMKAGGAALLLVLWLPSVVAAPDSRIRTVDYEPAGILQLTGYVGYHIHFEFSQDERFVSLGAGDTAALDIGAEGNHLFLKPKAATVGTNLTILTNRHAYFIDFRALARQPRPEEPVYSVAYRYDKDKIQPADTPRPNASNDAASMISRAVVNRAYWFCGSPSLRPVYVVDDGLQVHLKFRPQAELPAIYATSTAGEESLVNSHIEGDEIIVHRLAKRLVLRRGREVACVVNRGDGEHEQRADGGTLDPDVLRLTGGNRHDFQ